MKKILLIMQIIVLAAFAQTSAIWDGTADTDWYYETETEFTITTAEQLAGLAKLVNDGNLFGGKTVKLGANIMLNDTTDWQNWAINPPENSWTPIGINIIKSFRGYFDGNSFVVSGVYIVKSDEYRGLFGRVDSIGTIEKLGIIASYIKTLGEKVGGLAGENYKGTINNSYFIGDIIGMRRYVGGLVGENRGIVSNSYSIGTVEGRETSIGGLVGANIGSINNSYSASTVTGTVTSSYVGGLVGQNTNGSSISFSYSIGPVTGQDFIGGLVGASWGIISSSYSTGTVMGIGVNGTGAYVGGLAGLSHDAISSSYSTGTVIGTGAYVGGLVGDNISSISNSYSTSTVTGTIDSYYSYIGGLVGSNGFNSTISNSYSTGTVTGTGYYVGGFAGAGSGPINSSYYDKETSGLDISFGGEDKTTKDMKTKATFVNWDFDKIWGIDSEINNGYPYLRMETPSSSSSGSNTPIHLPQIARPIQIRSIPNTIILENIPINTKVEVYNLQGKRIYSTSSHSLLTNHLKIIVKAKGMYIVKINTTTFRVSVMF